MKDVKSLPSATYCPNQRIDNRAKANRQPATGNPGRRLTYLWIIALIFACEHKHPELCCRSFSLALYDGGANSLNIILIHIDLSFAIETETIFYLMLWLWYLGSIWSYLESKEAFVIYFCFTFFYIFKQQSLISTCWSRQLVPQLNYKNHAIPRTRRMASPPPVYKFASWSPPGLQGSSCSVWSIHGRRIYL